MTKPRGKTFEQVQMFICLFLYECLIFQYPTVKVVKITFNIYPCGYLQFNIRFFVCKQCRLLITLLE